MIRLAHRWRTFRCDYWRHVTGWAKDLGQNGRLRCVGSASCGAFQHPSIHGSSCWLQITTETWQELGNWTMPSAAVACGQTLDCEGCCTRQRPWNKQWTVVENQTKTTWHMIMWSRKTKSTHVKTINICDLSVLVFLACSQLLQLRSLLIWRTEASLCLRAMGCGVALRKANDVLDWWNMLSPRSGSQACWCAHIFSFWCIKTQESQAMSHSSAMTREVLKETRQMVDQQFRSP